MAFISQREKADVGGKSTQIQGGHWLDRRLAQENR
jgi:hypothetical protein